MPRPERPALGRFVRRGRPTERRSDDESRPTDYVDVANDDGNLQTVYEQYWQHARHVENQLWSFTRIWAVVLTAILTIVGTNLPVPAPSCSDSSSLMGLFMVSTLRVPFLAFTVKSEAIVVDEFDVDISYTRFINDWVEFDGDGDVVEVTSETTTESTRPTSSRSSTPS